jgi:hypothetical protein
MRVVCFVVMLLAVPGVAAAAVGDPCADATGATDDTRCEGHEACDPYTLTCSLPCGVNDDCASDEFCDPSDFLCRTGARGSCNSDADCGNADLCKIGDIGAGVCITDPPDGTVAVGGLCLTDADCLAGDLCDAANGLCVAGGGTAGPGCTGDSDCASNETCYLPHGICVQAGPLSCLRDADCAPGAVCDPSTSLCILETGGGGLVLCTSTADCAAGAACLDDHHGGMACALAQFTDSRCTIDSDCARGRPVLGTAVTMACVENSTGTHVCAEVSAFLVLSASGSGTLGDENGPELAPRGCSAAAGRPDASWAALLALVGAWLLARRSRRLALALLPMLLLSAGCDQDPNGDSRPCTMDADCSGFGAGYTCQSGRCGECFTDAECAGNPNGSRCRTSGVTNDCTCLSDVDCGNNTAGNTRCNVPDQLCGTPCQTDADCAADVQASGPTCDPTAHVCVG